MVERNGRIYGTVGEWARKCGITLKSARYRIVKAQIQRYDFPDYRWTLIDLEDADRRWALVDSVKAVDWNQKQQEERRKRLQVRAETGDRSVMRGKGGRPSIEQQREAALRRLMIGDSSDNAAVNAKKGSESPDLDDFEASPEQDQVLEQEFGPDEAENDENAENQARNLVNNALGLSVDDVDNLNVDLYVAKLVVDGMPPKMASEFAGRLLRMKIDLHEFRKLRQSLVPLQLVRDFESQVLTALRGALIPIGGELRDDLAACSDPVRCQEMIDERIYGALRMVASFKTGPAPGPGMIPQQQEATVN